MKTNDKAIKRGQWLMGVKPLEWALFLKWLLRVRRVDTEAQGMRFAVDPASNFGLRVLKHGNYEAELTHVLRDLLFPGNTFVDVGANEGWFSVLAATQVGPGGRVLAMEPQERLWPVILTNAGLNKLSNLQLLPYAIAARAGRTTINLYPSLNTGSSHIGGHRRRWEQTQEVDTIPLEQVLDGLNGKPVDLLKMDVEGFECEALRSAGDHLGTTIRRLVVEIHAGPLKALGSSEEEVRQLLRNRGYESRDVGGVELWELR
jgi:FkbM family methyltransferase